MTALFYPCPAVLTEGVYLIFSDMAMSGVQQVKALAYPLGYAYTLEQYANVWQYCTAQPQKIRKDTLAMQSDAERFLISAYQQVPGITISTAVMLKDESGDLHQFKNKKQLFRYLGLVPHQWMSGHKHRVGRLQIRGQIALRKQLIHAAVTPSFKNNRTPY